MTDPENYILPRGSRRSFKSCGDLIGPRRQREHEGTTASVGHCAAAQAGLGIDGLNRHARKWFAFCSDDQDRETCASNLSLSWCQRRE